MTLVDLSDGERSTARLYAPRNYGQVRGIPSTALDKLLQDKTINDAVAGTAADPYAPNRSPRVGADRSPAGNVVTLPARAAPAPALDNPLDAGHYADMDAALRDFCEIYPWPLSALSRGRVVALIDAAGLERQAVRDLALRLAAMIKIEQH